MPVLFLHLLEERSDGCWIGDIGRHGESLHVWMRFGDAFSNFFELVGAASDKDYCFCASGSEGGNESLMYVSRLMIDMVEVFGVLVLPGLGLRR